MSLWFFRLLPCSPFLILFFFSLSLSRHLLSLTFLILRFLSTTCIGNRSLPPARVHNSYIPQYKDWALCWSGPGHSATRHGLCYAHLSRRSRFLGTEIEPGCSGDRSYAPSTSPHSLEYQCGRCDDATLEEEKKRGTGCPVSKVNGWSREDRGEWFGDRNRCT